MKTISALTVVFISDAENEFLGSLAEHLAMLEEQLESTIRMASRLPVEQQDAYWSLAKDLQKEIRLTRKQIEAGSAPKRA